jgi:anti-sigma factor RsiW
MTRWITCREFVDFLDDYLAGALPPDRQEEFNNHLSGCPSCVVYLQTYQESIRLGRAALVRSEEPVPDSVPEELIRIILAQRGGN